MHSLNRLQTNISCKGVKDSLLKIGEPVEFEKTKAKGEMDDGELAAAFTSYPDQFEEEYTGADDMQRALFGEDERIRKQTMEPRIGQRRQFYSPTHQLGDTQNFEIESNGGNTENTGSRSCGKKSEGGILDDLADTEGFEEFKAPKTQDDLGVDLQKTKKGGRDRLYSSSEIIKQQ